MIKSISCLLVFLVLLSGCESLVNDLDADKLPDTQSKLVVECYISPQSPFLDCMVTESQPLYGPSSYNATVITHAEVVLTGEGQRVQLIYDDSTLRYRADTSAFKIMAGRTYTLTVSDGKRNVKASSTVPVKSAVVDNVEVTYTPTVYNSDTIANVKFSWEDIRGETNYYAIRGYFETQVIVPEYTQSGDITPVRRDYKSEMIFYEKNTFNDINLDGITFTSPRFGFLMARNQTVSYLDKNGKEKSFDNEAKLVRVRGEVLNIDPNYYKFNVSLQNGGNGDNPFIEPTLTFTNIEGGLGCFGSYIASGKTIEL